MRFVLLFVLALSPLQVEPIDPTLVMLTIESIVKLSWNIYTGVSQMRGDYATATAPNVELPQVMDKIAEIARDVDRLNQRMDRKLAVIADAVEKRVPRLVGINAITMKLKEHIDTVDELYKIVQNNFDNRNPRTIESFIETVTDVGDGGLNNVLRKIYINTVPRGSVKPSECLVGLLEQDMQAVADRSCDLGASPHQFLYDVFSKIMLTELRAFTIFTAAYGLQPRTSAKLNPMDPLKFRQMDLINRTRAYFTDFQSAMVSVPRTLWRCASSQHERGKSFHEFERLIGTVIVAETVLRSSGVCTYTCPTRYTPARSSFNDCVEGTMGCWAPGHGCKGMVSDCEASSATYDVCVNQDTYVARRYKWYRIVDGKVYGDDSKSCSGTPTQVYSWWNILRITNLFRNCLHCICTCTEDDPWGLAGNFVSLKKVVANVRKNRVITGLKFIRRGDIVQIQIQSGELGVGATIQANTTSWNSPAKLVYNKELSQKRSKYDEELSRKRSEFVVQDEAGNELKLDEDIAVLTRDNRTFNLDALYVPKNHVVTGVKFTRTVGTGDNKRPLQLEIQATPFDYKTGKLGNVDSSFWITPENMRRISGEVRKENKEKKLGDTRGIKNLGKVNVTNNMEVIFQAYKGERRRITQNNLKNPLDARDASGDFTPNKWITVEKTGLEQDAGQTVIPMLDGLPIEGERPQPWAGVHLFHKAEAEYGGFLTLGLISVDRTDYMVYNATAIEEQINSKHLKNKA